MNCGAGLAPLFFGLHAALSMVTSAPGDEMAVALTIVFPVLTLLAWGRLMVRQAPLWQFMVLSVGTGLISGVVIRSDGFQVWAPLSAGDLMGALVGVLAVVSFAYRSWRKAQSLGKLSAT